MQQRVLLAGGRGTEPTPRTPATGSTDRAWRAIGWLGILLALVGVTDIALTWYPPQLGSPEWEFGTVAVSFGGLPLVTMGLAGLLGAGLATGSRGRLLAAGIALTLLALFVAGAYLVFVLDVPLALRGAPAPAQLAMKKAIVRTTIMALGFFGASTISAIVAFGPLRRQDRRERR